MTLQTLSSSPSARSVGGLCIQFFTIRQHRFQICEGLSTGCSSLSLLYIPVNGYLGIMFIAPHLFNLLYLKFSLLHYSSPFTELPLRLLSSMSRSTMSSADSIPHGARLFDARPNTSSKEPRRSLTRTVITLVTATLVIASSHCFVHNSHIFPSQTLLRITSPT